MEKISLKTQEQITIMKDGGRILGRIRDKILKKAVPGVSLKELDRLAEELILKSGGTPAFKGYRGFPATICPCVNDKLVHCLPTNYKLKSGDNFSLDIGMRYKGLITDCAWTIFLNKQSSKNSKTQINKQIIKFLKTGEIALNKAIKMALVNNRIGHISQTIEKTIENAGYYVVKTLVGHGVGKNLHEPPLIPCFLKEKITQTPKILPGMILAIEVIYNFRTSKIIYKPQNKDDKWTIASADAGPSAIFEHTILVTKNKPLILTK